MAQQEIEDLSLRKARLTNECNALREELQACARDLRAPAETLQTGIDFTLGAVGWLHVSAPYRRARRHKWLTLPQVVTRFLQWQLAP